MIEPTAEMIAAHETARRAYWRAIDHDTGIGGMTAAEHERVAQRQAMAAALAVVERDYDVRGPVVVHLATKGDGNMHCCGRTPFELPPEDRITLDPHGTNCQGPYT